MEVRYLGHSSFLIKTKNTKIVTDPYDSEMVGLRFPKVEADIITISHSHPDHSRADLVGSTSNEPPLVIDLPGEFEKKDVRITGLKTFHDDQDGAQRGENIVYKIEAEDVSVVHLGDIGLIPSEDFLDLLGEVDILIIPTGGFYTIGPDEAEKLVRKIEPSVVIPMHYYLAQLNQRNFDKLRPVAEFLKKFGLEKIDPLPKLVYKKKEQEKEMEVIVLEVQNP
ncbi:MAG: MBL fold metallo-hydrolase [Patescibacteria group bacterium]|nr:MBL fold metallo-hydrolase [Patescibacteria group bacterium]